MIIIIIIIALIIITIIAIASFVMIYWTYSKLAERCFSVFKLKLFGSILYVFKDYVHRISYRELIAYG